LFLVMELVEGQDLGELVRQDGPLPIPVACDIIRQAALGLGYVHQQGRVHRDVKPSNLMLTDTGQVKILDLGLALLSEREVGEMTGSGLALGTPQYMAPEQAIDSHLVDARADVYSLGCTLYKLLTGKPPYVGRTELDIAIAHRQSPIPSLFKARPDAPASLDAIYRKMMAKRPEERYASMNEVIAQLDACMAHQSEWPENQPAGRRRRPIFGSRVATAAVWLSLAAVICLAAVLIRIRHGDKETTFQVPDGSQVTVGGDGSVTVDTQGPGDRGTKAQRHKGTEEGTGARGQGARGEGRGAGASSPIPNPQSPIPSSPQSPIPSSPPPSAVAPFDAKKAREHQEAWAKYLGVPVEMTNSIGMKFVLIPPGEFDMGSTPEEQAWAAEKIKANQKSESSVERFLSFIAAEGPRHRVKITRPFYMGMYPVTQAEYERVTGSNPSLCCSNPKPSSAFNPPLVPDYMKEWRDKLAVEGTFVGKDTSRHPVETVSWHEAVAFCSRLSSMPEEQRQGNTYRLPTEAQWEYACRAGTTTRWYNGDDLAKYSEVGVADNQHTVPVGQKYPNAWNLHDLYGKHFRQWCADCFDADYYTRSPAVDPFGDTPGKRSVRGATTTPLIATQRSASRYALDAGERYSILTFRVVCEIPQKVESGKRKTEEGTEAQRHKGTEEGTGDEGRGARASSPIPNPQSPIPSSPQSPIPSSPQSLIPSSPPPSAVAPFDAKKAREHQEAWAKYLGVPVEMTNSIGMEFVLIPPGEFDMGSTKEEQAWMIDRMKKEKGGSESALGESASFIASESPVHRVKITWPFYLGKYPVTQAEYERVMGINPSAFAGKPLDGSTFVPPLTGQNLETRKKFSGRFVGKDTSRHPVDSVAWLDAAEFCVRLAAMSEEQPKGNVYRLPTEAQWEYACRAGTTTRWYNGDDAANFGLVGRGSTTSAPVGEKYPNAWSMCDMYGLVDQWCSDTFSVDYYAHSPAQDPEGPDEWRQVRRGGVWGGGGFVRSASRKPGGPDQRSVGTGFRVVCEIPRKAEEEGTKAQRHKGTEEGTGVRRQGAGGEGRGAGASSPIPNPQTPNPCTPPTLIPSPPSPAIAPFDASKAREYQEAWAKYLGVPVEMSNFIGMKFVLIPPGEFDMGSSAEEQAWATEMLRKRKEEEFYLPYVAAEGPRHRVKITRPFYLGKYPVTQAEYQRLMGTNPSAYTGKQVDPSTLGPGFTDSDTGFRAEMGKWLAGKETSQYAVDTVSWEDGVAFCVKLSAISEEKKKRCDYRLPTEAQWEYACRVGTTTRWYNGDRASAFVLVGRRSRASGPVGGKYPNAWNVYDMYGLVHQWCADCFTEDYYAQSPAVDPLGPSSGSRIMRGSSANTPEFVARSASRRVVVPAGRSLMYGFRVVCDLPAFTVSIAEPPKPKPSAGTAEGSEAKQQSAPPPAVAPFDAPKAREHQAAWGKWLDLPVEITNSIGMKFVLIPPGEFDMGSTPEDQAKVIAGLKANESLLPTWVKDYMERVAAEGPRHRVKITRPFYLGMYPVTQAEYQRVMGINPSICAGKPLDASAFSPSLRDDEKMFREKHSKNSLVGKDTRDIPVDTVSWHDCVAFCVRLSSMPEERQAEAAYRLPTEAQWEYACRAGTTTLWYNGDDPAKFAEMAGRRRSPSNPVGQNRPNSWRLFDLYGRTEQWCADFYTKDYYATSPEADPLGPERGSHVARGGDLDVDPFRARSAFRRNTDGSDRFPGYGLRLLREIPVK
jgi:formylglycine-generating enzyme required for sulfatase activity